MFIIQIADLHVGSSIETEPKEMDIISKSIEVIKDNIPEKEEILVCLCGDIIDSKGILPENVGEVKVRYRKAEELIVALKRKLEDDYKIHIKCCPGNHDITHLSEMYDFVEKVDDAPPSCKELGSCYSLKLEDARFIFVNSCAGNQYQVGRIDYKSLEKELGRLDAKEQKIIILHHTLMSMFEGDNSSIRDAAKLVGLINKHNVSGVLHGHIHGREILELGNKQCKVIGTGALFSRGNTNVNSQFNIIELRKDTFRKILNCRYNADGGDAPWDLKDLCEKDLKAIFRGESFQEVYQQLLNKLSIEAPLYNVRMEISTSYKKFMSDLKKFLTADYLQIGEKRYDYFQLAEMWQAEEIPDTLYFNHGSYFKVNDKSGVDFIVEQLQKKSTSNRILLPTYDMEKLVESLDDSIYLPSLESIQFGKNGNELIVDMRLRALEANRFLKVNICEIEYLLRKLKERSIAFDNVKIVLTAFRVQQRDRFNCFLKAEIDVMKAAALVTKVNYHKIDELCRLFQEKRDGMETITKMDGIEIVYEAMKESNNESGDSVYNDEILDLLGMVLAVYQKLDKIHKKSSIRSKEEEDCEKQIDELLGKLIDKLKEIDIDRKETV